MGFPQLEERDVICYMKKLRKISNCEYPLIENIHFEKTLTVRNKEHNFRFESKSSYPQYTQKPQQNTKEMAPKQQFYAQDTFSVEKSRFF